MKICLLGAESTGKSVLTHALAEHFRAQGRSAAVIGEVLREWCDREGRTPQPHEQRGIAQEQEARVDAAEAQADVVIADTSALMIAIYSAMLFADESLYPYALQQQRRYHATLVTGLDLPWVADGLQRDGPHVREPVDARVREALQRGGVSFRVVYGSGAERLENALVALDELQREPIRPDWVWPCEKCSDPECEHRLFRRLM